MFLVHVSGITQTAAQDVAKIDRTTQPQLRNITAQLAAAMQVEDAEEIQESVRRARELLGDQAGLPEEADEFRVVPQHATPLAEEELPTAFDIYVSGIERMKWWQIGLDATETGHALREVASVIEGCLAARTVADHRADELLTIACDAGDFLIWAQNEAGTGVLPFPAVRNGQGRPFQVAEAFYRRAERDGKLEQVIRNGWAIEDFDDGGLQFDNGVAGVALVRLYHATGDDRYRTAAIRAADWAVTRPIVTNWNYNSFSVWLLAETSRISNAPEHLRAARTKALLGVLPGQLTDGPRRGRWLDPHNARPPYHYIMIRAIASLADAMPPDDPAVAPVMQSLRMALAARNPDFERGIFNADSSVEALIRVQQLPSRLQSQLDDTGCDMALLQLERYAAERFRRGKPALSPGAWGQLLAWKQASDE